MTTGGNNFLLGTNTGAQLVSGGANVAIGSQCYNNGTDSYNVSIGYQSLTTLGGGSYHTALGTGALRFLTAGFYNVAIGANAARGPGGAFTASYNTVVGYAAGLSSASGIGGYNTLIGTYAGNDITGTSNVCIGYQAADGQAAISNQLWIANSNTSTPLIYGLFTGAGAGVTIHSQNTAGIPLIVKGIAAQASNLQDWQDSTGTALMEVEASGCMDYQWAMGNSTKDPTSDAPTDWVEIKIGGTTYYLPAYDA